MTTKTVISNSGMMDGLEPCTNYALEVAAVYHNNATVDSEEKKFQTQCGSEALCDEEEWQESFQINQQTKEDSLEISASWRGCENDHFMFEMKCSKSSENCKEYSSPGTYETGQFNVILSGVTFCTAYLVVLTKDSTSIQREIVSLQNTNVPLILPDITIEMKSSKYGHHPSLTEGTITATWTNSYACILTYGIRLCQEETCGESVIAAAMVGE